MSRFYYIGIGGTGARVAEALIHLCAAGHGPEEFFFFLVDPDQANGNLTRTKDLLAAYRNVRRQINGGIEGLFGTDILTPDVPEDVVWRIFDKHGSSLARFIEYPNLEQQNKPLAQLAETLFTSKELATELNEGFRGHPAIGSVVMASPPNEKDPWRAFWSDISKVSGEGDAKVFLAGSIFGGTGAAGVPTFGARNVIKFNEKARIGEEKSRVKLGGCLVLPYFSFDDGNIPVAEQNKLHVTWKDFPLATRAALDYYALRDEELAFDDLYLLGDNLNQSVGGFGAGTANQENRPHYVELVAALAALDFWNSANSSDLRGKTFLTAARPSEIVTLDSLPVTRNDGILKDEHERLRLDALAMTVFGYALSTYGLEVLGEGSTTDAWYKKGFSSNPKREAPERYDPKDRHQKERIALVAEFGTRYLCWLAGLGSDDKIQLIQTASLLEGEPWKAKTPRPRKSNERAFGGLLPGHKGESFSKFIGRLNDVPATAAGEDAATRFLSLFARAARHFAQTGFKPTNSKEAK